MADSESQEAAPVVGKYDRSSVGLIIAMMMEGAPVGIVQDVRRTVVTVITILAVDLFVGIF